MLHSLLMINPPKQLVLTPEQEQWMRLRLKQAEAALVSVRDKVVSGEYPLEEQRCFCGADVENDKELKQLDRMDIPHRVVVCQKCAIVRANPRMTSDAYRRYYNDEYRLFLYRLMDKPTSSWDTEFAIVRDKERNAGKKLQQALIEEDISMPQSVLDIGCFRGGMLDYFKERGAETYGVEWNDDARASCSERGHQMTATIDEMIEKGVKVDLVIMQDVIEHLLDLNDMWKVHKLLKPDAYLYIFTPGLFRQDPKGYWQLAHTWYFVANTLVWTMARLGFMTTYVDEDCTSFWQYVGLPTRELPPPVEWVDYIVDEVAGKEERKLPPFSGTCKYTKKLLYDNMRRNFALKVPDIYAISGTRKGPLAILGGGPSADGQVKEIKRLKAEGVPLIVIARMYPWCLKRGIKPDFVVSLDCSEEQEAGFKTIEPTTTHMMASVTRPEIVESVLKVGAPMYLFDSRDDRKIKDLRRDAGYEIATVINSGGTVVVTCMAVAFNLGYTDLHVFGFDCMFPNRQRLHAKGIAGKSVDQRVLTVEIDGKTVLTTPSFLEFARQALDLFSVAHNEGLLNSVKVYGESIVNRMWDGKFYDVEEEAAA